MEGCAGFRHVCQRVGVECHIFWVNVKQLKLCYNNRDIYQKEFESLDSQGRPSESSSFQGSEVQA